MDTFDTHRAAAIPLTCAMIFLLGLFAAPIVPGADTFTVSEQVRKVLEKSITAAGDPPEVEIGGQRIRVSEMLPGFYRGRDYRPAWQDAAGPFPHADALVSALRAAGAEGLRQEFYRVGEIESALKDVRALIREGDAPPPERLARLDLLLTDAFLAYGFDILAGRVNPSTIEGEWSDTGWEADLPGLLKNALDMGMIREALENLNPPHPAFQRLRLALARYRDMAAAGGWAAVPPGTPLERGDRGGRVGLLRARLAGTEGPEQPALDDDLFDESLEQSVLLFQARHGLAADGIVGPKTLEALNVPVERRIRQIELNMERWRWLPPDLGERFIAVNSADFLLKVYENSRPAMEMRVVVGEPYWHTPNFSALMTYIVLNPSWNVPSRIVREELLPAIRHNPGYLRKQGYLLFLDDEEIDPESVDWQNVPDDVFPYRLIQPPGLGNPLGMLKFMFPNRFSVYLHDTPSKGLFSAEVRTFSHGCIRIEKPLELARYLLRDAPGWTDEKLMTAIEEGKELAIHLANPLKVHLLYWTAWVEEDGTVHFRDDIYGRDELLNAALFGDAPAPPLAAHAGRG